jgi:hypothetical protein
MEMPIQLAESYQINFFCGTYTFRQDEEGYDYETLSIGNNNENSAERYEKTSFL